MRGGLRTRLIVDSVRVMIIAGLEQLGWFDSTVYDTPPGPRTHQPFHYITRPYNWDIEIIPNSLAINSEDVSDTPLGLGGDYEDTIELYLDLFAQDDELGWHVIGDIRDLILGKNPELGRISPMVDVYDFRQATPAPFTQVELTDVRIDRAQGEARDWQRHWFMIRINAVDDYADEGDANHPATDWQDDIRPTWERIQAEENP